MPIWWFSALPALMVGSPPLPVSGGLSSRRLAAAYSFRCLSVQAKHSIRLGEDYAVIGGERTKLQVAHIKLSHSRAFLVRAYLLQTHEMLFDAHWHGFRVFGGVPGRGIYDNMKTAVDRVGRGKERQVNVRFQAMTNHYVLRQSSAILPQAGRRTGREERSGCPTTFVATDAGLSRSGGVE